MMVHVGGVNDNKLDNAVEVAPFALFSKNLPKATNEMIITRVSNKTAGGPLSVP